MAILFKIKTVFGHHKEQRKDEFVLSENLETLNEFFEKDPHLQLTSVKILDRDIKEVTLN